MRALLYLVAVALVALGIRMLASPFLSLEPTDPKAPAPRHQIASTQPATPAPVIFGVALIAGGVLFFILLSRR